MPDLQTALSTAIKNQVLATTINEWDNEEKQTMQTQINTPPAPTLTGNLSKDIFTYIKENPGCSRATVYKRFSEAGANSNSVGSLITQILRNKLAVSDNLNNLTAVRVHYKPLVSGKKKKQLYQKAGLSRTKAAPKSPAQGIAALAPEPSKGKEALDRVLGLPVREARAVYDALCVLRDLDVGDARHLYAELHKLFGG